MQKIKDGECRFFTYDSFQLLRDKLFEIVDEKCEITFGRLVKKIANRQRKMIV